MNLKMKEDSANLCLDAAHNAQSEEQIKGQNSRTFPTQEMNNSS